MPKCIKPSCNRGCCGHDHSSKAEQAPSIVDIEVVRKILSQAVVNMCKRAIACAEGELTRDELAEKDMKLMEWLGETFCGNNSHFEPGPEDWTTEGLAEYIKQALPQIEENPEGEEMSSDEVVVKACAIFVEEAYKAIHDALKAGFPLLDADELPAPVASFVRTWTLLFVGAPMGSNN